jgi:hypothetical protein
MFQQLFQLLGLRNDALICGNGDALRQLGQRASYETQKMMALGNDTASELRGMRVITFINLAYAPGAIVAVQKTYEDEHKCLQADIH